jgi:hypothetical protein
VKSAVAAVGSIRFLPSRRCMRPAPRILADVGRATRID